MIHIDFPELPKFSDRTERQEEISIWYERLKTCLLRQLEELSAEVDTKQDKN